MFVLKADELGLQNEGFIGMGWLRELPDFRDYTFSTCLAPDQSFLNLPQNVFRPEKLNNIMIILVN
jgi:hypothetical protein